MSEQLQENQMPKLDDLFFNVCKTAIDNVNWAADQREQVDFVIGQLAALRNHINSEKIGGVRISSFDEALHPLKPTVKIGGTTQLEPTAAVTSTQETPNIPMPDAIVEAVMAGVAVAKNPPKVAPVIAEPVM